MAALPLHIVADENMPHVAAAFDGLGRVHLIPGRAISPQDAREADVLLVRSVTRVGPELLDGSRVRFVASATIGTDHVDRTYLQRRGIKFAHAPGCNADSVVEFICAALLHLSVHRSEPLRGKTVGIVGCGNIGGRLARRLPALGLHVLQNDPPLARAAETAGAPHPFLPLETVLDRADIVTIHVPLTRTGPDVTVHLFDEHRLRSLRPDAWLLNAARGPVVNNAALERALRDGRPGAVVLDVWENEPEPDPALLRRVDLATPHIAGYSYDGRVTGTIMIYEALTRFLERPGGWDPESVLTPTGDDHLGLVAPDSSLPEHEWLHELVRQAYPILDDDARMRARLDAPTDVRGPRFTELRRTYPRRRTFDRYTLDASTVPANYHEAVRDGLQIQLDDYP